MINNKIFSIILLCVLGINSNVYAQNTNKQSSVLKQSEENILLRISHSFTSNNQHSKSIIKLKELIEVKFPQIKVTIADNSSKQYNSKEELEALDLGLLDMIFTSVDNINEYYNINDFEIFNLPFLLSNDKDMDNFMDSELNKKMLFSLSKKYNFIQPICFWPDEVQVFISKSNINSLSDINKRNFGITKNELKEKFIKSIGGNPIYFNDSLPSTIVNSFKNNNNIDIIEETTNNILSNKLYENGKNIIVSNHKRGSYVMIVNKKWFSSLSEKVQEELTSLSQQIAHSNMKYFQEIHEKNLATLKSNNRVNIFTPSNSEIEELKRKSIPVHETYLNNFNKNLTLETYQLLKKK